MGTKFWCFIQMGSFEHATQHLLSEEVEERLPSLHKGWELVLEVENKVLVLKMLFLFSMLKPKHI